MSKKYDTLVFIGRFQPVHEAHLEIIRRASLLARKLVIIVGSANQPRTYKNPFTSAEREQMLQAAYSSIDLNGCEIFIEHNTDSVYNDQAWAIRIQEIVARHSTDNEHIGIIGHEKDESSFYLKMFPQWDSEEVELIEPLNATDIRDLYFRKQANLRYLSTVVPKGVNQFLYEFVNTTEYMQIIKEREFISTYKKQFEGLAYPPVFVTADAVVLCSGHVLMIKRKAEPGKGLWALPGGFLNAQTDKSVQSAAIRELKEETGIKLPIPVLTGSIVDSKVFDAVDRSARGRTITHAFKIVLPDGDLPRVRGMDDAEKARWVPIAAVKSEECFEDHYDIIMTFVGS